MKISSNRKPSYILKSPIVQTQQLETKKILRKLTEAEKKCLDLFHRTSDAVIMMDKSWRYTYLNNQAGKLLHRSTQELIGKVVWEEFPHAVAARKVCMRALKEQKCLTYTEYYPEINVWAESHIYPDKDGLTLFVQDISEKKKLELKLTAATLHAREKERNAIGEELHDNVNQILVSTRLILSTLNKETNCDHNLVDMCIQQLQSAIEENRRISQDLVTPQFENSTLVEKIDQLVHKMLGRGGLNVNVNSSFFNDELLNDEQRLCVYRIAQEQCCNIVRHSEAKNVNISLATCSGYLVMHITDDGVGISNKNAPGIGLRNMKSRLAILKGTIHTYSSPGKGFSLEIMLPLEKQVAGEA